MSRINLLIVLIVSAWSATLSHGANTDSEDFTCGHQQGQQQQQNLRSQSKQYHSLIRQRTNNADVDNPTRIVEWPWHAAVFHRVPGSPHDFDYQCGATLIRPNQVLTAAHCVTQRSRSASRRSLARVDVLVKIGQFGASRQLQRSEQQEVDHKVSKIVIHRDYDPDTMENDLAVVELRVPVIVTPHIQPICLWNRDDRMEIRGRVGAIVGRRLTENDTISLSRSEVPPVGRLTQCSRSDLDRSARRSYAKMLCVEFKNENNVCNGDSGGGMYFKDEDQWFLGGVITFFSHEEDDKKCQVVFTDVSLYLDWIDRINIHEELISEPTEDIPDNQQTDLIDQEDHEEPISETMDYIPDDTETDMIDQGVHEKPITEPTNEHPNNQQTDLINQELQEESITEPTDDTLNDPQTDLIDQEDCGTNEYPFDYDEELKSVIQQYPWMIILQLSTIYAPCSGVLINRNYILTADCFNLFPINLTVTLGDYRIFQERDCYPRNGDQNFCLGPPLSTTIVESFRNEDDTLVLARLEEPISFSDHIRPICLPTTVVEAEPKQSNYILTGWKYFGSSAQFLQRTLVDSMPEEECRASTGSNTTICVRNLDILAGSMRCNLYKPGAALQAVEPKRNRYTLYGVQSGLVRCSQPSRFVNVAKYMGWIVESMRS